MASSYTVPSMQDLLEAGVHFGHQTRRGNPRMRDFIFGVRGGVHIVNLEETEKRLKTACEYVYSLGKDGKILLFVGTKKQAQPIVTEWVEKLKAPYVIDRWIGGALTNFDEIKRNIKKLNDLKEQRDQGQLNRYTKKEQLLMSRKLSKFNTTWGGVSNLETLPDALFIIDAASDKTAVKEASKLNIPIVAITDTNSDPFFVDYPIPGNDDATKSIKILVDAIGGAYEAGLKEAGKPQAAPSKDKKDKKVKDKVESVEEELKPILEEVAAAEEEVEKVAVKEAERIV